MTADVFIDSDALIGLYNEKDAHHQKANKVIEQITHHTLCTSNFVINETATVLSVRANQNLAVKFLSGIDELDLAIIHVDEALQRASWKYFQGINKKGTSVVDCSNVVLMKKFGIPRIWSFDKFYRRLRLDVVG